MKGLGATVKSVLSAIQEGKWNEFSGKIESLGLVSADDMSVNYVQLPTDTWTMKNFTVADYRKLVAEIFSGSITVSNETAEPPAHSVKLNMYPSIK